MNPISDIGLILLCVCLCVCVCVCACNFYNTSPQSLIHQTTSYAVMRDCWLAEPGLRPSFSELAEKIASILTDGSKGVSHVLDEDVVALSCHCYAGLVVC